MAQDFPAFGREGFYSVLTAYEGAPLPPRPHATASQNNGLPGLQVIRPKRPTVWPAIGREGLCTVALSYEK